MLKNLTRDAHGFYTVKVQRLLPFLDKESGPIDVKVFGQFGFAMLFVWIDEENDKDVIHFGICRQSVKNPEIALQEGTIEAYQMRDEGQMEQFRRKLAEFGFGTDVYGKIYDVYAQLSWYYKHMDVENLPPCKPVSFIND